MFFMCKKVGEADRLVATPSEYFQVVPEDLQGNGQRVCLGRTNLVVHQDREASAASEKQEDPGQQNEQRHGDQEGHGYGACYRPCQARWNIMLFPCSTSSCHSSWFLVYPCSVVSYLSGAG